MIFTNMEVIPTKSGQAADLWYGINNTTFEIKLYTYETFREWNCNDKPVTRITRDLYFFKLGLLVNIIGITAS